MQKLRAIAPIAMGILLLAQCSGMSGSPGGTAPGGAVGEAPSGAGLSTGSGGDTRAALPISGPVAAASGGILTAPADDDLMGGCDPKAFLAYDKDYSKIFEADFESGLPWRLNAESPFVGNFSVMAMGGVNVSGMQVRALRISADKSKVAYRDFLLNQTTPPHHPISLEFADPEDGERLELYYFPLVQTKTETIEDPACVPRKSADFSESWIAMSAAEYEAGHGKSWKIPLAAFKIQLFYRIDRGDLPKIDFPISK